MLPQEYFYTVEPVFKHVSKEEFVKFIKEYPRSLDYDCYGACDPPAISYNDFALANRWPYSIVARTFAYDDDPNGYYYCPENERTYAIMTNYQEVFESKTGNVAGINE